MAKQTINVGTIANDRTGDPLRIAFTKTNANFTEVYDNIETTNITVANNFITVNDRIDNLDISDLVDSQGIISGIPTDVSDLTDTNNLLEAANTGDIGFLNNFIFNSSSFNQSIWITPGSDNAQSTSWIHIPGNSESDDEPLTISNSSETGGVQIISNDNEVHFDPNGRIRQNSSLRHAKRGMFDKSTPTVIWSSSFDYISSAKLLIQIEAHEFMDSTGIHSQACEAIIASRGSADNINNEFGYGDPAMTVYGIVHTSAAPLVTFTIRRNSTTRLIEVVATAAVTVENPDIYYSVSSVEMMTWN